MAMEVPKEPKIYTTSYDGFRGCDYTNDATNVWRRRSPSALNMTPDEAGRPFKRTGWKKMVTLSDFNKAYNTFSGTDIVGDFIINSLKYFTLGGEDYIIVFSNVGVFRYYQNRLTCISTDEDCITSYERTFFFEGDGLSAFYIYGNYKMWRYTYDGGLEDITGSLYVPRIRYGVDADGEQGTDDEAYNMLYNKVKEQFYNNTNTIGSYTKTVVLQNEVSQGQVGDVEVWVSVNTQFDTELTVLQHADYETESAIPTGSCVLVSASNKAYIAFKDTYEWQGGTEDAILVKYPTLSVTTTALEFTDTVRGGVVR